MSPKHTHRATSLGLIAGVLLAATSGLAPASAAEPPPPPATQSSVRSIEDIRAALDYFESSTRRSEMRAEGRKAMTPEEVEVVRQAMRDCVILIARENPDAAGMREVAHELLRAGSRLRFERVPFAQREGLWTDAFAAAPMETAEAWVSVAGPTVTEPEVLSAWCLMFPRGAEDRSPEADMRAANEVASVMRSPIWKREEPSTESWEALAGFVDELTRAEWERLVSDSPSALLEGSPNAFRVIRPRYFAGLAGEQEVLDLANAFFLNPGSWEAESRSHFESLSVAMSSVDWEFTGGRRAPIIVGLHRAREDGGGLAAAQELLPFVPSTEPPRAFGSVAEIEDYMATLPPPPPRATN